MAGFFQGGATIMLFMKYVRWFYESWCVFEIWVFIHFEPKTEVFKYSIAERQITPHPIIMW